MAKATRICKVCGKEYDYCKTWLSTNKFRYQDVACSPECGAKYFALIEASRSGKKTDPANAIKKRSTSNESVQYAQKANKKTTKRHSDKTRESDASEIDF